MCGIAGLIGAGERAAATGAVRRMMRALAHRGPDGAGLEVWDEAVLGHRRLAIFDLSEAGRQPMLTPDRAASVVFNGAIYNFRELRAELEKRGYSFASRADTEVLTHGYREWGIDGLVSRLRGMFAFGLWDERAHKLFLVRDRLGVKPLVYAERDGQIAFASTLRALSRAGMLGEIDEQAMAEYLHFGYVTDDRAIYRGAVKVPAASIVEWSASGGLRARAYWSPPAADTPAKISFNEAVAETERLLLRAVERRLHADVPVGALLSGGVDSSLVCWAVAQLGGDITAYTVGVPDDPADEAPDARATAAALGIAHHVLEMPASAAPDISELAASFAEPFACSSALGMLKVSRAVAPAATVLLTGDGGDDVFLGYPEHMHLRLAQALARRLPGVAAQGWRAARAWFPRAGWLRRVASFMDYTTGGLGAVTRASDGLPLCRREGWLGERLLGTEIAQRQIPATLAAGRSVLDDYLAYDRRTRFVGEFLPKVDGATMRHALEARSPFLDQELWEFAASLPYEVRLRGGQLKAVLRELARRKISERVARGRKRGFSIPAQRWIAGCWRADIEAAFNDSLLAEGGWIRAAPVLAALARVPPGGIAPLPLWHIYALEAWMRYERSAARTTSAQNHEDNSATLRRSSANETEVCAGTV